MNTYQYISQCVIQVKTHYTDPYRLIPTNACDTCHTYHTFQCISIQVSFYKCILIIITDTDKFRQYLPTHTYKLPVIADGSAFTVTDALEAVVVPQALVAEIV